MKRICIVTTMMSSINNWIKPFLDEYHKNSIDVSIACNMTPEEEREFLRDFPFVHTYPISFPRGINVSGSIRSIWALVKLFKNEKFDMVQYSTPNASFYAAVASKIAKVPIRLYCQWGMVYVTMKGAKRKVFRKIERMTCKFSTRIQPDSVGNLEFCRKEGFYDESNSNVIWNGSAKGIDLAIFDASKKKEYAKEIKSQYGIPDEAVVVGFVGRLGKEKGCNELFRAFRMLKKEYEGLKLLFVGPIEKEDTIEPELLSFFRTCDDIIKTGRVKNVEKYMAAMDIFVLPSHREGFGMSVVEASAMEVPVVATRYPGPSGAFLENITGVAVDIEDHDALACVISDLVKDEKKRISMGSSGREFVEKNFDSKKFIEHHIKNRLDILGHQT